MHAASLFPRRNAFVDPFLLLPLPLRSTYVWKKAPGASNVVAVAATRWDTNALVALELLHKILEAFRLFCPPGGLLEKALGPDLNAPLRSDSIREKGALALSILEEAVEFGYPQLTQAAGLSDLVIDKLPGSKVGGLDALLRRRSEAPHEAPGAHGHASATPTLDVTGAVPWRKSGISYKKNEVYLDAIEKVSALVGPDGVMLSGSVQVCAPSPTLCAAIFPSSPTSTHILAHACSHPHAHTFLSISLPGQHPNEGVSYGHARVQDRSERQADDGEGVARRRQRVCILRGPLQFERPKGRPVASGLGLHQIPPGRQTAGG